MSKDKNKINRLKQTIKRYHVQHTADFMSSVCDGLGFMVDSSGTAFELVGRPVSTVVSGSVSMVAGNGSALGSSVSTVAGNGSALGSSVSMVAGNGSALGSSVATVAGNGSALGSSVSMVAGNESALGSSVTTVAECDSVSFLLVAGGTVSSMASGSVSMVAVSSPLLADGSVSLNCVNSAGGVKMKQGLLCTLK